MLKHSFALLALAVTACSTPTPTPTSAPSATTSEAAPVAAPPVEATPPVEAKDAHHEEHGAAAAQREATDADGFVRRGAKLTAGKAMTVSDAYQQASTLEGKPVKVTGKVSSVCQPMGCWMQLTGDKTEEKIRVTTEHHDVFLPKGSAGRTATIEGKLVTKTLEAKMAQHLEDDAAPGKAKKIDAPVKEVTLYASGIELAPAS